MFQRRNLLAALMQHIIALGIFLFEITECKEMRTQSSSVNESAWPLISASTAASIPDWLPIARGSRTTDHDRTIAKKHESRTLNEDFHVNLPMKKNTPVLREITPHRVS